ncbi:hypothetical protein ACWDCC_41740 [Streptomyces sp. NPDC001102]|uniref:hypothetical protein n=1 Tax=Streptomyces sp. NPDC057403 TaxID=3346119 RepID=UPI0036AF8B3C
MTPIDRTPTGTETSSARYAWLPVVTTLATLAAVLILAFTGHGAAAVATATLGAAAGSVQITVHIRR